MEAKKKYYAFIDLDMTLLDTMGQFRPFVKMRRGLWIPNFQDFNNIHDDCSLSKEEVTKLFVAFNKSKFVENINIYEGADRFVSFLEQKNVKIFFLTARAEHTRIKTLRCLKNNGINNHPVIFTDHFGIKTKEKHEVILDMVPPSAHVIYVEDTPFHIEGAYQHILNISLFGPNYPWTKQTDKVKIFTSFDDLSNQVRQMMMI